jgi:hypothetical protein
MSRVHLRNVPSKPRCTSSRSPSATPRPSTAAQAATVILDGVRAGKWRILIGDDAHAVDRLVRASPEDAYELAFVKALHA